MQIKGTPSAVPQHISREINRGDNRRPKAYKNWLPEYSTSESTLVSLVPSNKSHTGGRVTGIESAFSRFTISIEGTLHDHHALDATFQ